jgi:hypothetical protein
MQSTFRLPLFLVASAAIILASCGKKTNEEGRYIPKNAAVVVLMNGESIFSKLSWSDIKENELFKQFYLDSTLDAYVKTALDNPDNTGVDIKKDFLFYIQKDSLGGYVAVEGTVKDAAKFKQFYAQALKGATEVEKDGIHAISGGATTASWKNDKFILVIDAPQLNDINKFSNSTDRPMVSGSLVKRDGAALSKSLFDLKENASMGKDEKFTELVKQKGDIHFWLNMGEFSSAFNSPGMKALSMVNLNKIYDGSITTATADFDNGKINLDMKSYSGKELSAIWKKYEGNKANTDMMKRFSGKDVAMMFALNFKPEGIRELVKELGFEGLINMGAAFLGFNLDDFVKANKGDLLLAVSDFITDSSGRSKPGNFLFAATVGDKASFGKLIDAGNKMGKTSDIFYNTNDKYFAIGNNKESINKFTGAGANSNFDFIDKISGSPLAGYINFQYLMKSMEKEGTSDSSNNVIYQASLKLWDNLIWKGGEFNKGGSIQHIEVNFLDKSTNSLKLLNSYIGLIGKIEQQKKLKRESEMTAFPEPVEEAPVTEESMAPAK